MEKQMFWSSPRNNFVVAGILGVFVGLVLGVGWGVSGISRHDVESKKTIDSLKRDLAVEKAVEQVDSVEQKRMDQTNNVAMQAYQSSLSDCQANFTEYTVLYDTTADPQGAPSIPLLHGLVSLSLGPAATSRTGARWLIPAKIAPQIVGANPNNAARYLWIDAHTGEIKSQVFLPAAFSGGGGD